MGYFSLKSKLSFLLAAAFVALNTRSDKLFSPRLPYAAPAILAEDSEAARRNDARGGAAEAATEPLASAYIVDIPAEADPP